MKKKIFIFILLYCMVIVISASSEYGDKVVKQAKYSSTLRSALSGDPHAQYSLGKSYRNGEFTDIDIRMSVYWLELAVAQNDVDAIRELADIYLNKNAGNDKVYRAMKLYRQLADTLNDTDAMINIGRMYQHGIGVSINSDSAYYWYNKALGIGAVHAQSYLQSLKQGEISIFDGEADDGVLIIHKPQPLHSIAFVLGNSDYSYSSLPNPTNDAKALQEKLKKLGIKTKLRQNLSLQEMYDSIDAFAKEAAMYDVAIFYYAGHAVQNQGENYLMPIDVVRKKDYSEILTNCMNVDSIFGFFRKYNVKSGIVILDACRDNRALLGRSRGLGEKGLSPSSLKPLGTFVAYATQPGEVADDGEEGGNSPFMKALLSVLDQPNKQIYDVFEQVKVIVTKETKGLQIPVYMNNLRHDYIINNPELYER